MNKSVPTLLGIVIILVVVVLVVLIYNIKLTQQLGTGATPTGTVGGEILTGEEAPTTTISPGERMGLKEEPKQARPQTRQGRQAQREGSAGARRGQREGTRRRGQ